MALNAGYTDIESVMQYILAEASGESLPPRNGPNGGFGPPSRFGQGSQRGRGRGRGRGFGSSAFGPPGRGGFNGFGQPPTDQDFNNPFGGYG